MSFSQSIYFLCSVGFHFGPVLIQQSEAACEQCWSLACFWISFPSWQDTDIVNQTSNFRRCYYHIDSLVSIKASTSINFLQLKSEKSPELFMAGSCRQPTPTWTPNPALKFSVGSLAKNAVCFMIANPSFSVAVKRLRLLLISWTKCTLLLAHSCICVPQARLF